MPGWLCIMYISCRYSMYLYFSLTICNIARLCYPTYSGKSPPRPMVFGTRSLRHRGACVQATKTWEHQPPVSKHTDHVQQHAFSRPLCSALLLLLLTITRSHLTHSPPEPFAPPYIPHPFLPSGTNACLDLYHHRVRVRRVVSVFFFFFPPCVSSSSFPRRFLPDVFNLF